MVCLVKSGTQPINFSWYRNGEEFKVSSKSISIENSPVTSALILSSVSSDSDGNYTCTAKNSFGKDDHSTSLKVKGKKGLIKFLLKLYFRNLLVLSDVTFKESYFITAIDTLKNEQYINLSECYLLI